MTPRFASCAQLPEAANGERDQGVMSTGTTFRQLTKHRQMRHRAREVEAYVGEYQ